MCPTEIDSMNKFMILIMYLIYCKCMLLA